MTSKNQNRLGLLIFRLILLIALVIAATWLAHLVRDALKLDMMPADSNGMRAVLIAGIFAYVILLAIPFVPGAEIGIALLGAFGASVAPVIYAATVIAMMLAYVIGRTLPFEMLSRVFRLFRMRRATVLIDRLCALPQEERLNVLLESAPPQLIKLALQRRYVALALAVNMPGNVILGGGGGILMMAGLSRLFAPLPVLLAILIGVSPVPLAVLLFGASL